MNNRFNAYLERFRNRNRIVAGNDLVVNENSNQERARRDLNSALAYRNQAIHLTQDNYRNISAFNNNLLPNIVETLETANNIHANLEYVIHHEPELGQEALDRLRQSLQEVQQTKNHIEATARGGYKTGGRVKATGNALVHKNEYVLPSSVPPTKAQKKKVATIKRKVKSNKV